MFDAHVCMWNAELIVIPKATPPEAAAAAPGPSASQASSLVHAAESNITSGGSCSLQLQEETLLCEALPGYLADMSNCPAPLPSSTWQLTG